MKARVFLFLFFLLTALASPLSAQEWRWEADNEYLNPHIDPGTVGIIPLHGPSTLSDLNGDGIAEYIIVSYSQRLHLELVEMTGEFPDITWRLREGFFASLELDDSLAIMGGPISHDLDGDGSPELILVHLLLPMRDNPRWLVFQNRGDYENPNWVQNDDLFPDIGLEPGQEWAMIPQFCDWDNDGNEDLILEEGHGFYWYERDHEGQWDSLGYYQHPSLGRGIPFNFRFAALEEDIVRLDALVDNEGNRKTRNATPSSFRLNSVYPNPFNSQTSISFDLDRAGTVDVGVFDAAGRRIATLAENQMEAGQYSLTWNAETSPAGVYLAKVTGPSGVRVAKMVLVR